jgi:AraC-like DNA-binding protein
MAVQPERLAIGEDVRDVFYEARLKLTAVAAALGLHPSHLTRALNGEQGYALDLLRMPELAETFGEEGEIVAEHIFVRVLLLMRRRRMAKADLRSTTEQKRSA